MCHTVRPGYDNDLPAIRRARIFKTDAAGRGRLEVETKRANA